MLPRLPVGFGLALLATLPALGGCSSSNRRDQFYGTDAAAYYHPEAAVFSNPTGGDADVVEAAADADGTAADAVEFATDAEARDATDDASAEESDSGFDS